MYAIRTSRGLLTAFFANDIPLGNKRKYNQKTDKIEYDFRPSNVIIVDNTSSLIYVTQKEAEQAKINFSQEVLNSRGRWENIQVGTTDKMLKEVAKMKVVKL